MRCCSFLTSSSTSSQMTWKRNLNPPGPNAPAALWHDGKTGSWKRETQLQPGPEASPDCSPSEVFEKLPPSLFLDLMDLKASWATWWEWGGHVWEASQSTNLQRALCKSIGSACACSSVAWWSCKKKMVERLETSASLNCSFTDWRLDSLYGGGVASKLLLQLKAG